MHNNIIVGQSYIIIKVMYIIIKQCDECGHMSILQGYC